MARIKLGSVVTDLSGSAGGTTIQNSRSGHILRNKPTPCNPASSKQLSIRSIIKSLQRLWISLSAQQRQQWADFPKWANQHIMDGSGPLLSGHDLFLKYQLSLSIMPVPLLTSFTYGNILAPISIDWINATDPRLVIRFSRSSNPAFDWYILKLSKPVSGSSVSYLKGLRHIHVPVGWSQARAIKDNYEFHFGFIPAPGDSLNWSLQTFSTLLPLYRPVTKGLIKCI